MAKKQQQQQQSSQQRKNVQQRQQVKSSGGLCSCLFSLVRTIIVMTAVAALAAILTYTAFTYNAKQRVPTLDEFKVSGLELYGVVHKKSIEYYTIAEKEGRVYYARFEKDYLPVIQKHTKEYTKLAVIKFQEFQVFLTENLKLARKKLTQLYADFQESRSEPAAKESQAKPSPKSAEKPTTPKPTAAPTPKPTVAAKPTTVKPPAAKASSKEKKEL